MLLQQTGMYSMARTITFMVVFGSHCMLYRSQAVPHYTDAGSSAISRQESPTSAWLGLLLTVHIAGLKLFWRVAGMDRVGSIASAGTAAVAAA